MYKHFINDKNTFQKISFNSSINQINKNISKTSSQTTLFYGINKMVLVQILSLQTKKNVP